MRGMISRMRKPTTKNRIVANSLPEIVEGLEDIATTLRREGEKGPFRAIADGNLHNAVSCWLLGQPKEVRSAIVKLGMKLYDSALKLPEDARADFEALLRAYGQPQYTGLPAKRLPGKKLGGANGTVG